MTRARRPSSLAGRASIYLGWLGWVQATAEHRDAARQTLAELEGSDEYVSPLYRAWIHLALEELEPGFELLDESLKIRDPQLIYLDHPMTDPVRSEPRFVAFDQRVFHGIR